jgi:hypothetical protein
MRTLYDCHNARYPKSNGNYLYCKEGHVFGNGNILKEKADTNTRLEFKVCQNCTEYKSMKEDK